MTKSKKPIIELKGVWKTYKMGSSLVHALRGLDLNIYEQDFVGIQGPSGSGKSTCMNLVGCLDWPTEGAVRLDGHDISQLHESDLAQIRGKKIGFVFQKFNLISTMTALQNVMLPMIFQGLNEFERMAKAQELLERVGLGDRIHHKPNELSGGQQQRVAIARALANDPPVLLADEPTGNLDSKTGDEIMQMLVDLNRKEKKTIILVTHDDELADYAKRVIFLKDGQITKSSTRRKRR